jgi:hypothetical protein
LQASRCHGNIASAAGRFLPRWFFAPVDAPEEDFMVERKIELRRRRQRHKKLMKLKDKLAVAKDSHQKETILQKIHQISPWWTEPEPAGK